MKTLIPLLLLSLSSCAAPEKAKRVSAGQEFSFEKVLERDEVVWGLDFLPDQRMIFTERSGKMYLYDEEKKLLQEIKGVPKVQAEGQGGLLDVAVHPRFKENHLIYFTYSEPVGEKMTTALGRGELKDGALTNVKKLFSASPANSNSHHFGSRIVLDGKHVYFGVGDRGERSEAQKLDSHLGSILRLNEDGTVPKDNPFRDRKGAQGAVFSYGHRNPQGLAMRPGTDEIWEAEMGPRGGDEVNLIEAGKNYGWPIVTFGKEYHGPKIGEGTHKEGMTPPLTYWVPSISPSGISFYDGEAFPAWKGNLFLANLSGQHLRRLELEGTKVRNQEELLKDLDLRFRQVTQGPGGLLYLTTDQGIIGRIRPVKVSP